MKFKSILLSMAYRMLLAIALIIVAVLSVNSVFNQIAVATEPLFYRHEIFFTIFGLLFASSSLLFWHLMKSNQVDAPISELSPKEIERILVKNLLLIFSEGVIVGYLKPKSPHQEE